MTAMDERRNVTTQINKLQLRIKVKCVVKTAVRIITEHLYFNRQRRESYQSKKPASIASTCEVCIDCHLMRKQPPQMCALE